MTDLHPSEIPGATDEYQTFLETWARHCGAPASVFTGQLNVVIRAELAHVGQLVIEDAKQLAETNRVQWKALDRLLTDLVVHLTDEEDRFMFSPETRGAASLLLERVQKARVVLGLDEPRPGLTM